MTESYDVAQPKRVGMGMPIVLGAAGAGAGVLANKMATKPMSHEDIIKEMAPDKIELHTKGANGATWSEAQKLAEEVKEAEKALENASKAVLPDTSAEQKLLNEAKEKLANEIKRLQGIEDAKAGQVIGGTFTARKDIPAFDKLTAEQLPSLTHTKGPNMGKAYTTDELKTLYDNLVNAVDTQETALSGIIAPLQAEKNAEMSRMQGFCTDARAQLKGKKAKDVGKYFSATNSSSNLYIAADAAVAGKYPIPSKLTPEQIMEFATEIDAGATKTRGFRKQPLTIKNKLGHNKDIWVEYDPEVARERLKELQTTAREQRATARTEIMESTKKAYELSRNISELPTTFQETLKDKIHVDKLKATGLYDEAAGTFNLTAVRSEGARYKNAIENLEKAISNAKKTGAAPATTPTGFSALDADPVKALEQLRKRKKVYEMFTKERESLVKQQGEALRGSQMYRDVETQIAETKNAFKPLEKARKALAEKFPNVAKFTEGETVSTGKTITESDVAKSFTEAVEKAQKGVDDAIAKGGGKIDEAAKEAAQKALDGKKKSFNDIVAKLGDETKISKLFGGKKWVAPVIGGAALLVAGLAIRSSKNKQQA